jgi:hypothetical protein
MDEHRVMPTASRNTTSRRNRATTALVVHGAAAVLDDEERAAEFLNEWERLDEGFGALAE